MLLLTKKTLRLFMLLTAIAGLTACGGGGGGGGDSDPDTYVIGGTAVGLAEGNEVVLEAGGEQVTISADGAYQFVAEIAENTSYTVIVATQPDSQVCIIANGSGTITSDITDITVTCTDSQPVGGTVTGLADGATVVLQNNAGDDLSIANDTFTFAVEVAEGSDYAVTVETNPITPNQICTVTNETGTVVEDTPVTDITVTCVNSYTVSGTVSGLAGIGLVLNNGSENLTIDSDATEFAFSTAVADGEDYDVTVETNPKTPNQTCGAISGIGTISADVTDVKIECVTEKYSVQANVTGLVGTLVLQSDITPDTTTIIANGTTVIAVIAVIDDLSDYTVSVKTNPTAPNQTCEVTQGQGTGQVNGAAATVNIQCTTVKYNVSITVAGLSDTGTVELSSDIADNIDLSQNGTTAIAQIDDHGSYTFTVVTNPTAPNQTCTFAGDQAAVTSSIAGLDVSVAITCTTNKYSIGGTAAGLSGTVVLQNNSGDDLSISANDSFTFAASLDDLSSYAATVLTQPVNQVCSVSNESGILAGVAVTDIALTCVDTYAVGVTVTGLASGNSVVLQNSGGDDLTVDSSTLASFTTRLLDEAAYDVTVLTNPTNPNQECTVASGSGAIDGSDVIGIAVECTTVKYTVGGTITGLAADKILVLQNNAGDDLTITTESESYPAFTFAATLDDESAYSATILTQPDGQQCAVTSAGSGSGSLAGANVTNITVECYIPNTLSIANHSRAVIASWNDTSADSYNLYYSKTDGFVPANCNVDPDCTAVEDVTAPFTVTDLVNDDAYYFIVEDIHGAIELESAQITGSPKEWEFNGVISTMAKGDDGTLYVGGTFTEVSGNIRKGLAAINADGTLGSWTAAIGYREYQGAVNDIIVTENTVYIGGYFTLVNGESRRALAALDRGTGELRDDWIPSSASSNVDSLVLQNGVFYVANRSGLIVIDMNGTNLDWGPTISVSSGSSYLNSLVFLDGILYFGGNFDTVNGEVRNNLAAIDLDGNLVGAWAPYADSILYSLVPQGNSIYVGGPVGAIDGNLRSGAASIGSDGVLSEVWKPEIIGGHIYTMAYSDEVVFIGGDFTSVDAHERKQLAAIGINGTLLDLNPVFGPSVRNNRVSEILVDDDIIYVGGEFTLVDGTARANFAVIKTDGTLQ